MTGPFDRMVDTVYGTLGVPATWYSVEGAPYPVTALVSRPRDIVDLGPIDTVAELTRIEVRRSEVATVAVGDVIDLGGPDRTFRVQAPATSDDEQLVWKLDVAPAGPF